MSLLRRGGLSSIDLMLKEVTDMSDYETFSLVIMIIGLVISAISLGITIGKKDKNNKSVSAQWTWKPLLQCVECSFTL